MNPSLQRSDGFFLSNNRSEVWRLILIFKQLVATPTLTNQILFEMKKIFALSLMLVLSGNILFTGCATDQAPQITITDQLLDDQTFTEAVTSTVDLVILAQDNDWMLNGETIQEMMRKSAADGLTAVEEEQLTELLGMDRDAFIQEMTDFGSAINDLMEKYPLLNDMSASERQDLFGSVIAENPELAAYMYDLYSNGRMCFLQDLCNLVVDLAVLIGGPFLCDVIAEAVPIIGPLLCNLVLDIAEDLLVGLCNALPC